MPYHFTLFGVEVTCDDVEELAAALRMGAEPSSKNHRRPAATESAPGRQGSGPKRAWAEAREYAAAHGVDVYEARRILSEKRRQEAAKAELAAAKSRTKQRRG